MPALHKLVLHSTSVKTAFTAYGVFLGQYSWLMLTVFYFRKRLRQL